MAAPQPAEFTTTVSAPDASKAATLARASRRACSRSPSCALSAPQQPCSLGANTRAPLRSSTRTLARCASPNSSPITHPVKSATSPAPAASRGRKGRPGRPSCASSRPSGPAKRRTPDARASRRSGERANQRTGASAAASARGLAITWRRAKRRSRRCQPRDGGAASSCARARSMMRP